MRVIETALNASPFYTKPINFVGVPTPKYVDLFDQNGYDLCDLEKLYAQTNGQVYCNHRDHRHAIRKIWMESPPEKWSGAVINHALLFERKGYADEALEQLVTWAKINPQLFKVAQLRPKWGLDFSIDFTDKSGRVFEILHFEYDSFAFEEIQQRVHQYTNYFLSIDWDACAEEIWARRAEWRNLTFEEQSAWKCDFFDIEPERFRMVAWNID